MDGVRGGTHHGGSDGQRDSRIKLEDRKRRLVDNCPEGLAPLNDVPRGRTIWAPSVHLATGLGGGGNAIKGEWQGESSRSPSCPAQSESSCPTA